MSAPDYVTVARHLPLQYVPEHQMLLDFDNDEDATAFDQWLYESGWDMFTTWRKAQGT